MPRLLLLILWVSLVHGACSPDLSLPEGSYTIACANPDECPAGTLCQSDLGRCVPEDPADRTPPVVLNSVVTPRRVAPGTTVEVTFRIDEPLGVIPEVALRNGDTSQPFDVQLLEDGREPLFSGALVVSETALDGIWSVDAILYDVVGNRATATLGRSEIDATPPSVSGVDWVDPPAVAGPLSRAAFLARATPDAVAVAARLRQDDGALVTTLSVSRTTTGDEANFSGSVDFAILGLSGTTAVQVELVVADDLGNEVPLAETTTPLLSFDSVPPETSLTNPPGAVTSERVYAIGLASPDSDVAGFECRLDAAPWSTCGPVWAQTINTLGQHTLAARAVDLAGNSDPTPATAVWSIERSWSKLRLSSQVGCGIATDTTLWCWGSTPNLGVPENVPNGATPRRLTPELGWRDVAIGGVACAVREEADGGSLWCWGEGELGIGLSGTAMAPQKLQGDRWASVVVGATHACATTLDQALYCWGKNAAGQLGQGDLAPAPLPIQVPGSWLAVAAGNERTCAIRVDHSLWCWGHGLAGAAASPAPVQVGSDTDWLTVDVGNDFTLPVGGGPQPPPAAHVCGLRATGSGATAWCWGSNARGALGNGSTTAAPSPAMVDANEDWEQIACGVDLTCGVRGGTGYCWGDDTWGALRPGEAVLAGSHDLSTSAYIPAPVEMGAWRALEAGDGAVCGADSLGAASCWGLNVGGQLGNGTLPQMKYPTHIVEPGPWVGLAAGGAHVCGAGGDGTLWCWGAGFDGQRGAFLNDDTPLPIDSPADGWTAVAAGPGHTCALRVAGGEHQLWCWGRDAAGERGDGGGYDASSPAPVRLPGTDWLAVTTGNGDQGGYSAGIRGTAGQGGLWSWGGLAGTPMPVEPTQIGLDVDWSKVDGGSNCLCGLRGPTTGARLFCLGSNVYGRCGVDPGQIIVTDPTEVGSFVDWVDLAVGTDHGCGLRAIGNGRELWCWGKDTQAIIGDDYGVTYPPTRVGDRDDWLTLDSGPNNVCAIRADGTLWCKGASAWGQSGPNVGGGDGSGEVPGGPWQAVACGTAHTCAIDAAGETFCWGEGGLGEHGTGLTFGPSELVLP
jgi:alpha-tubulin suppressor-like RCC1 family protein